MATSLNTAYLVVVHDFRFVVRSRDGVDDVQGAVAVQRGLVEELPLEDIGGAVSGHVGALKCKKFVKDRELKQ